MRIRRPIRATAMILTVVALAGVTTGCHSYVTFEGCSAEQVAQHLQEAIILETGHPVEIRPNSDGVLEYVTSVFIFFGNSRLWWKLEAGKPGQTTASVQYRSRWMAEIFESRYETFEHRVLAATVEAVRREAGGKVVAASAAHLRKIQSIDVRSNKDHSEVLLSGVSLDKVLSNLRHSTWKSSHDLRDIRSAFANAPREGRPETPESPAATATVPLSLRLMIGSDLAIHGYRVDGGVLVRATGNSRLPAPLDKASALPADLDVREAMLRRAVLDILRRFPSAKVVNRPSPADPPAAADELFPKKE